MTDGRIGSRPMQTGQPSNWLAEATMQVIRGRKRARGPAKDDLWELNGAVGLVEANESLENQALLLLRFAGEVKRNRQMVKKRLAIP